MNSIFWKRMQWRIFHLSFSLSKSVDHYQITNFSVTNDHFMLCGEHFWTHLTSHLNPSSCKVQIPLFLQVLIGCYTPSSRSPSSVELWFVMEFPIMLGVDWTTLFSIANDLVQPPSLVLPYIILLNLTLEFRF